MDSGVSGAPPAAVLQVEQLRLSDSLADFGERHADAMALIEAAKLRKMLPVELDAPATAGRGERSSESLLRRATQLAGEDPTLKGLIADVRAYHDRDIPSLGDEVKLLRNLIKQRTSFRAEVRFKAGETAVVYLRPEGPADLVLNIYDEFNNLICRGDSGGQGALCRWRPRFDGRYLLDVHNDAGSEVRYQLVINREVVAR